jgi:hypothetical protein
MKFVHTPQSAHQFLLIVDFAGGFLSVVFTEIFLEVVRTVPAAEKDFVVKKFHSAEPFFFLKKFNDEPLVLSTFSQRSEKFNRWVSAEKLHFSCDSFHLLIVILQPLFLFRSAKPC